LGKINSQRRHASHGRLKYGQLPSYRTCSFFSATILPKFSTFPPYPSDPSEKKQDGGLTATVTICRKASVGITLGTIVLGIGEIVIVDLRHKL
jgi:hypothetical protein